MQQAENQIWFYWNYEFDQILKQMRTNFERNLEDSVDRVKNSVACNDVEKNDKGTSFLWLHLERVGNWSATKLHPGNKKQMATRNSPGNKEICQKPDTHNSIKRWQWEKIPKETNQMLAINTSREAKKRAKNEIHLDKFVSRGWDLLSSSSLEVGHTRWDVLALPSKWWKLWWFYDSADFFWQF